MACRSAGKVIRIAVSILAAVNLSCIYLGREQPLSPRLLFTTGSSFLDGVHALALKGRLEFNDGKFVRSGSFHLFLSGLDSLSLLIEGPLSVDVFKMVISGDTGHFLSEESDGWKAVPRGERVAIGAYGIDNISPFLAGFYIFPQFYLRSFDCESEPCEFLWDGQEFVCEASRGRPDFDLRQKDPEIIAEYSRRKDLRDGYYPSRVTIRGPNGSFILDFIIDKLQANPRIPPEVWGAK